MTHALVHDAATLRKVPDDLTREHWGSSIAGQVIELPDLHQYMDGWDHGTNEHLPQLQEDVIDHLSELFEEGPRLRSLLSAKAADFAAQWWPDSDYQRLQVATRLSIWLFAWDDETDSEEFSDVSSSLERSKIFRRQTIKWCEHCLGFGTDISDPPAPESPLLRAFDKVGSALRQSLDPGRRRRVMEEIEFFVEMCGIEQTMQAQGHFPTLEEYQRIRFGTSAVNVCLSIAEYTYGLRLPERITSSPHHEALWKATNRIISMVNDILSVRKELMNNRVDSLVPILAYELGDVQAAFDKAATLVHEATLEFEDTVLALESTFKYDPALPDLHLIIRNCRTACTANLNWSLGSGRYKLGVSDLRTRPKVVL